MTPAEKITLIADEDFPVCAAKIHAGVLDASRLVLFSGVEGLVSEHVSIGDGIVTLHLIDRDESFGLLEQSNTLCPPDGPMWLAIKAGSEPVRVPPLTQAEFDYLWPKDS